MAPWPISRTISYRPNLCGGVAIVLLQRLNRVVEWVERLRLMLIKEKPCSPRDRIQQNTFSLPDLWISGKSPRGRRSRPQPYRGQLTMYQQSILSLRSVCGKLSKNSDTIPIRPPDHWFPAVVASLG